MQRWDKVAIVGVGLIGGSIGRALLERGIAGDVVGIGRRSSSLRAARQCGAVTRTSIDLARGVRGADLIVVCTPVDLIVDKVCEVARNCAEGALVTDAGSTKDRIVSSLAQPLERGVRFLGSHPMAGGERVGPREASPTLLDGKLVIITPSAANTPADVREVTDFWKSVGARVKKMAPAQHDRVVAAISHVPHIVASALVGATSTKQLEAAARGFADTTRIAAGNPEMWMQILDSNRASVLAALEKVQEQITSYEQAIRSGDRARLKKMLTVGKQRRDSLGD
jgi:prephenate dehydrogenase